jgi:hypothetical protein
MIQLNTHQPYNAVGTLIVLVNNLAGGLPDLATPIDLHLGIGKSFLSADARRKLMTRLDNELADVVVVIVSLRTSRRCLIV